MKIKSINLFKKRLIESGVNFTDSLSNALWLLPDGSMIDGEFNGNNRGQDHKIIFSGVDYGNYYMSSNTNETHWKRIHREYKVIRLCPEPGTAIIKEHQCLTQEQENILESSSYKIEKY